MSDTSISREQLRKNRTVIPLTELHLWEQNPREVMDMERVKQDMKGVQTVPLLVMADGTILGGNSRFQGMVAVGKRDVWVSVVEFDREGDRYSAYINGERDLKTFKSVEDGMKHYALKNNQEYARYLQMEVIELAQGTELNLDDYMLRPESGELLSLKDIMQESEGTTAEDNEEEEKETTTKTDKKLKVSHTLTFPVELVSSTDQVAFEDWLNKQLDELMTSMLDQFKRAKDVAN